MKALPKKLLPLTLFAIAVTSLLYARPAQAYSVTLQQVGSNVVAHGSGAISLTGLTLSPGQFVGTRIAASFAIITMSPELVNADAYNGFTGPTSFGSGGLFSADSFSGDVFAFDGTGAFGGLFLLQGYVSGTALSNSMTFNNQTFASLGVTPGTYVWTWGTGLPNQNFTLIIGRAGVPDGGSTVSLLGCALLGLAALRWRLGC